MPVAHMPPLHFGQRLGSIECIIKFNAESFQLFVDAFAQAFVDSLNILPLNNSAAYTAQRLTLPANVRLVFLPPHCPELNPIERVWRALKDDIAWQQLQTAHRCKSNR
jgi:hypothetical protein